MKIIRLLLATSLCVVPPLTVRAQSAPPPPSQQSPFKGGFWWREKSHTFHEAFISGYRVGSAHEAGHEVQLSRLGVPEMTAGVDKFYDDFRNRSIGIDDALLYVTDQLSGVPDAVLNDRVLHLRAAAVAENHE